jgi:hypothetical protein
MGINNSRYLDIDLKYYDLVRVLHLLFSQY